MYHILIPCDTHIFQLFWGHTIWFSENVLLKNKHYAFKKTRRKLYTTKENAIQTTFVTSSLAYCLNYVCAKYPMYALKQNQLRTTKLTLVLLIVGKHKVVSPETGTLVLLFTLKRADKHSSRQPMESEMRATQEHK